MASLDARTSFNVNSTPSRANPPSADIPLTLAVEITDLERSGNTTDSTKASQTRQQKWSTILLENPVGFAVLQMPLTGR